jgi:hypothetical protein
MDFRRLEIFPPLINPEIPNPQLSSTLKRGFPLSTPIHLLFATFDYYQERDFMGTGKKLQG